MRHFLSKKVSVAKKLLISSFVFIFLFYSALPALALTSVPAQKPIVSQTQTATNSSDKKTVVVPGGTETGRVLCSSIIVDCIGDLIGSIKDHVMDLLGAIFTNAAQIIAAALGPVETLADACAPTDVHCTQIVDSLAKYDPFLKEKQPTAQVNLMTLLDSGYGNMYANIPQIHAAPAALAVFQNNLLGVGKATAQGTGTKDLTGVVEEVWGVMRNLSYIFTALALVVIGFMVMLRRRLDPRTVVTATNSLPRVAIALILITFSFAISGLFIDLIYVLVFLTRNALHGLPGLVHPLDTLAGKFGGEFVWLPLFTLVSKSIIHLKVFLALLTVGIYGPGLLAFIPLLAALLLDILVRLGLFVLAIMLFWSLLTRFAQMVVLIIFSPFFFLAGAIPGFETLTLSWFKRMLAVVITFPAILIIVYIAVGLLSPTGTDVFGGLSVPPPLSSGGTDQLLLAAVNAPPPLGGANSILNIEALIGLGILYFAHKIPGTIDEIMGTKGSKEKGIGPMVLVGGALGAAQTAGTINKSAPMLAGLAQGSAFRPGIRGTVAGGLMRGLSVFDRNLNPRVKNTDGTEISKFDKMKMDRAKGATPGKDPSTIVPTRSPLGFGTSGSAASGGSARSTTTPGSGSPRPSPTPTRSAPSSAGSRTPTPATYGDDVQNELARIRRDGRAGGKSESEINEEVAKHLKETGHI